MESKKDSVADGGKKQRAYYAVLNKTMGCYLDWKGYPVTFYSVPALFPVRLGALVWCSKLRLNRAEHEVVPVWVACVHEQKERQDGKLCDGGSKNGNGNSRNGDRNSGNRSSVDVCVEVKGRERAVGMDTPRARAPLGSRKTYARKGN